MASDHDAQAMAASSQGTGDSGHNGEAAAGAPAETAAPEAGMDGRPAPPGGGPLKTAGGAAGDGWSGIGRQLLSLLLWVLVALALRALVVEPRWIPSGSMLPALQLQDRILVEKVRPRLGRPLPPGTVVVFHPPAALVAAGYDPEAALIKRVVAGPGDRVEVRGGRLLRNGSVLDPDWAAEPIAYDLAPVALEPGQLWVLGDNRNASLDSHVWGPLPREEVIGTAIWRYWPLRRFGPLRFSPIDAAGRG